MPSTRSMSKVSARPALVHSSTAGGAEASKQERTELDIALPAFEPDLLDPRNVGARILRQRHAADRPMQIHRALAAQRHESRMHLGRNRSRMRPAGAILGPQP